MRNSLLFGFSFVLFLLMNEPSQPAQTAPVIRVGTLAPKNSPMGLVLQTWEKAVNTKSAGRMTLQLFYNGAQGDEAAMVAKIKAGQLDGAAVSTVGLSKVYKPILVLRMAGLFRDLKKFLSAWNVLAPDMEKGINEAGFTLAGSYAAGKLRWMSKTVSLNLPDSLQGKKPLLWRDDPIMPVLYQVIGKITGVPLNTPEVLPNLNTGALNAVYVSAYNAEQWQWAPKLDRIAADADAMDLGALVFSSSQIDQLPEDLKKILLETGKIAAGALNSKLPVEDEAAFNRLKTKMTPGTRTATQQGKWDDAYRLVRQRLAQGTLPADLISKTEGLAK